MSSPAPRPWFKDPVFWVALAVGLTLRALPMLVWGWADEECTRDECIFQQVAEPLLEGQPLPPTPAKWLPAPGYPYLLAACKVVFGRYDAVKWLHWALLLPTLALLYGLGRRLHGTTAARWLAVGFAIHPTFVFYTGTMWTETVYTFLLVGTLASAWWARDGSAWRGLLPGVALGLTVLTRGVATYLAPIVVLGLVAPVVLSSDADAWRTSVKALWRHAAAFAVALVVTVAPWSVHQSRTYGGLVISDATLGHVLHLGNDHYLPITFDYGIGQLTGIQYTNTLFSGRGDCPRRLGVLDHDRCEVQRAVAYIRDDPAEFVGKVPIRWAQLLNPHTFLTRHLRWDYWPGIPWGLKEALVVAQFLSSTIIIVGGTLAAWARAKGPWAVLTVGTVLYHLAVISALYGLSRFRLPLEPLWMCWLAVLLADPRGAARALYQSRPRLFGAMVTVPLVAALLARYAWTGWPGFFEPHHLM